MCDDIYVHACISTRISSKQKYNIHKYKKKTESTLRRDRCSRHQWLYSHETSRVYVRCSRTHYTVDPVPRTVVGRRIGARIVQEDDEEQNETKHCWSNGSSEQSRKRSQKNLIARTHAQVYLCGQRFWRKASSMSSPLPTLQSKNV